ncbi:hypothetical protein F4009_01330 [Candidatus Poribacteria bacterium]|nr:hypothetical protein [Candidatus Poribacteria bacterium]MYH81519.1 hypothetical protein [Candidatus Poribacteria bacterium]MYK92641.1 hypothetical protein [Candidatus Poribacteria bacterium]
MTLVELVMLILGHVATYVVTALLAVAVISVGIRWGLTWTIKEISKDPELESCLKRILNTSEKPNYSDTAESTTDVSNRSN